MSTTPFDFASLLPAGLPPAAARWTGRVKFDFTGGNNDADSLPLDGLMAAATAVLRREGRTLSTYGLSSGPQGYRPLRDFLASKLKAAAGIACTADDILITSGSLQALDLINATLLQRGDTVIIEEDCYQGSINRLTRLGVTVIGIPLDRDGMRMDALSNALDDLQRKGVRAKYIYTIPTVQNPTATIMPVERRQQMLQLSAQHGVPIFEDDCYADLTWSGERPPAIYALSDHGGVIHIGSFSKSIAPALRVGFIVAPWEVMSRTLALKTDGGSGALEQMVLADRLHRQLFEARAGVAPRSAGKARHADRSTAAALRAGGAIRRCRRRHLPVGHAARRRGYREALSACARGRGGDQPGPRVVGQQEPRAQPAAAVLREPQSRGDQPGRRHARPDLPPRVRPAELDRSRSFKRRNADLVRAAWSVHRGCA